MSNNKENNILKAEWYEIINDEQSEFIWFYDIDKGERDDYDRLYSCELEKREEKGEIVIFPWKEELYPYGKAMRDFLQENDIIVPRGTSAIGYLKSQGENFDFYEYRNQELKAKLLKWLEEKKLPIEII